MRLRPRRVGSNRESARLGWTSGLEGIRRALGTCSRLGACDGATRLHTHDANAGSAYDADEQLRGGPRALDERKIGEHTVQWATDPCAPKGTSTVDCTPR